jgi:hypothetical protein
MWRIILHLIYCGDIILRRGAGAVVTAEHDLDELNLIGDDNHLRFWRLSSASTQLTNSDLSFPKLSDYSSNMLRVRWSSRQMSLRNIRIVVPPGDCTVLPT